MCKMMIAVFILCGLTATPVFAEPTAQIHIKKIDNVESASGQEEISGLVRSRTYNDIWCVHNDTDVRPTIFPIHSNGDLVKPGWLKPAENYLGISVELSTNIDWEDIAIANGLIYIVDTGNNNNARRDLGIYVIAEPNPRFTKRVRTLEYLPIRFPEQKTFPAKHWHFDCESLFISDGNLYFITKHRQDGEFSKYEDGANLYSLSLSAADPNRINVLDHLDSRIDMYAPTGADISPDGKRLAVLTRRKLWVFTKPNTGDKWLTANPNTTLSVSLPDNIGQAEAICWDTDMTMKIINEEKRDFFLAKITNLR